jgi:hypothetical protein
MESAFQFTSTYFATTNVLQPTGLVFQLVLCAEAWLRCEERAFRTSFFVSMAIMRDLWVTAISCPLALEATGWWPSTARKWRLKDCPPTITANLLKDSLAARATWSLVAQLLARMVAAFKKTFAWASAYVLCLEPIQDRCRVERPGFAFRSFNGLLFPRTTMLPTLMSSAVEVGSTYSHTFGKLLGPLVTHCLGCRTSTAAVDRSNLDTGWAVSCVA